MFFEVYNALYPCESFKRDYFSQHVYRHQSTTHGPVATGPSIQLNWTRPLPKLEPTDLMLYRQENYLGIFAGRLRESVYCFWVWLPAMFWDQRFEKLLSLSVQKLLKCWFSLKLLYSAWNVDRGSKMIRAFRELRINLFNSGIQLFCIKVGRSVRDKVLENSLFLLNILVQATVSR